MKGALLTVAGAGMLVLAGCGERNTAQAPAGQEVGNASANTSGAQVGAGVDLLDPDNRRKATATVFQAGDALQVRLEAFGMPAGTYAAHVHTTGTCTAPTFESAGGHWNPTGAQHGSENPAGAHKGDLPNMTVGADGNGSLEFTVPGATVAGGPNSLLDADGAAVMIHAKADDYRTDPAGNAGNRIACGVLRQLS